MIGKPFNILTQTDSTNNHAMRMIKSGKARHGEVYFAIDQSAGKGQSGRQWNSAPGKNLMISIVLLKDLPEIKQLFSISVCTVLACLELFNKRTGGDMSVKWPNDLFWRDRKAGGILIENAISGISLSYSIIGIGLNINQTEFPELNRKVVSLKQITGKSHDPIELAEELCVLLGKNLQSSAENSIEMLDIYNQHLFMRNQLIGFSKNNQRTSGLVQEVRADGSIGILEEEIEFYRSGEIVWHL